MDDTFKTLATTGEGLYKDKGSKFIAFAHPVASAEEAKALVESYRKKYHDARHVCYAYALGENEADTRSSDDGEPSGTAGKPILGQIRSFGLTNVLVVVIRYFGGVLLGTGGLAVAYRSAAAEALSQAEAVEKTYDADSRIRFEFPMLNEVMKRIKAFGAVIVSQTYETGCIMHLRIRRGEHARFEASLQQIDSLQIESE